MFDNIRILKIDTIAEAEEEVKRVGSTDAGVRIMAPKAIHRVIKVEGVTPREANILKQEMLARGGEAAVAAGVIDCKPEKTDVLLMGTFRQYELLADKLALQPFSLPKVAGEIKSVLLNEINYAANIIQCRDFRLDFSRTLIMGVLNVTPDSFSDGGKFCNLDAALERAQIMVEEGADIIDIGGESTRPNAMEVDADEEIRRIAPLVELLVKKLRVPISIDTYKASVAKKMLEVGAHIINDVWGLEYDPDMAKVIAQYDVPVVIMHNRKDAIYNSLMSEVIISLRERIRIAEDAGISPEKIIIDPGFGFGKTTEHNLEILRKLEEFKVLGKPILIGTSRKSMVGNTLKLPVDQRLEGTAATVVAGVMKGANIIRVHDIKSMYRVTRMTEAIMGIGDGK